MNNKPGEYNMNKIEFISHDAFPDDEYTKELVYLCLDGKYRIAYVRKAAKNGGIFWSVANIGAMRNGQKEFFPAFMQDSNFLEKDIKDYLEKRKWEQQASVFNRQSSLPSSPHPVQGYQPQSMKEVAESDDIPF